MLWAEHVTRNTARERDDVFTEVRQQFNDAELLELTMVSGRFNASNRFQDTMCLPIEGQDEVDRIRRTVRADPNRIKAFIEKLIEYWPREFPVARSDEKNAPAEVTQAAARPGHAGSAGASSRIALLDPDSAAGEAARFFANAGSLLGGVSYVVRMWGHIPFVAKFYLPFKTVLEREGAGSIISNKLKMMVLIRTAHLNEAPYSLAHHSVCGRAAGVSEAQLAALRSTDCVGENCFSPAQRAALLWAECIVPNAAKSRDDLYVELRRHFSEAEIVELTGQCANANTLDRIYNALRLPPEPETEIMALNRSLRVEPDRLRNYLAALLEQWPTSFPIPSD